MREAAHRAMRDTQASRIGAAAARFDRYPGCDELRYVHGSSGLTGFARGGKPRHEIEEFYRTMSELMGRGWMEWGAARCASNFAVANSPGAVLLPYQSYSSFHPGGPRMVAKCLHFAGTHRFEEAFFAGRAREEIRHAMRSVKAA